MKNPNPLGEWIKVAQKSPQNGASSRCTPGADLPVNYIFKFLLSDSLKCNMNKGSLFLSPIDDTDLGGRENKYLRSEQLDSTVDRFSAI